MKDISKAPGDLDEFLNGMFDHSVKGWLSDLRSDAVSPVDTGDFRKAWSLEGGDNIKIDYRKKYTISNPLDYAETITFGNPLPRSWGGVNRVKDKATDWFYQYWNKGGLDVLNNAVSQAEREVK